MKTNTKHIMLGDAARRELTVERERLASELERLTSEVDRLRITIQQIDALVRNGTTPSTGRNLRDAILTVLRAHPDGLRPIDVTNALKSEGFQASGKTPLELLISNNLWRMARDGVTRRTDKNGRYKLLAKAESETASP